MRKSQFHLSRSNLKPSRKISTSLKNSTFPPPRENCLTITKTITSNNRTKSQPLPKNPNPSGKNINTYPIHEKKIATLSENFSVPIESFPTLLKFLNPSEKISTPHEKISTPPEKIQFLLKNLNPSQKNLNTSRKNLNHS